MAPFLQKVGVAVSLSEDVFKRFVTDTGSFGQHRLPDGCNCVLFAQRAYWRVSEQSLGVGLGVSGQCGYLWQAGAKEQNRQVGLIDSVQRDDQRAQILGRQILHLIDEQRPRLAGLFRRLANLYEQVGKVQFQITTVRNAWLRLDRDRCVSIADPEGSCKGT